VKHIRRFHRLMFKEQFQHVELALGQGGSQRLIEMHFPVFRDFHPQTGKFRGEHPHPSQYPP